ncbi:MAG: chemotaxis protein CheX [Desulfamplus sp.]|nr:chemotaxis protein CheX [Desulfamplus sp.]
MTNLMTQIAISISEVMETMFYIPVEPRSGYTTLYESDLIADSQLNSKASSSNLNNIESAKITFHGTFSGEIVLIAPENLLVIMTENFMGEERDNLTSEHIEGTLKEALNMLAGNTFSKLDSQSSFGLGVPDINTSDILQKDSKKNSYSKEPLIVIDTMDGIMGIIARIE